jgi:hypothetical protein
VIGQEQRPWNWAGEHRRRGVLLLRQPGIPQAEAEAWLQRALDVVRRQEAKSLELRASISLARLWQQQGKRAEAYELLAPIDGWFTRALIPSTSRKPRRCLVSWGHKTVMETCLTATLLHYAQQRHIHPAIYAGYVFMVSTICTRIPCKPLYNSHEGMATGQLTPGPCRARMGPARDAEADEPHAPRREDV